MTELEKIQYAKSFIDKLANGINPLDDTIVKDDDVVNNVRLSRCFFYVSDILRQVIENGGVKQKKGEFLKFYLSAEQISEFSFSEKPIPISEIAKRINALITNENMRKISYRDLTNWLLTVGMLFEETGYDGKIIKRPTEQGNSIGISTEVRTGQRGEYVVVVYNQEAQTFIIDNIEAIVALKYGK